MVGKKKLVFCNGYNGPNLQKRSLLCREHGPHKTCYPLWSIIRLSVL